MDSAQMSKKASKQQQKYFHNFRKMESKNCTLPEHFPALQHSASTGWQLSPPNAGRLKV
jgi:hypothetical protein